MFWASSPSIRPICSLPVFSKLAALCQALGVSCDAFMQGPAVEVEERGPGRPKKGSDVAQDASGGEAAGGAKGKKGRRKGRGAGGT